MQLSLNFIVLTITVQEKLRLKNMYYLHKPLSKLSILQTFYVHLICPFEFVFMFNLY